jgi:hypothetical protein
MHPLRELFSTCTQVSNVVSIDFLVPKCRVGLFADKDATYPIPGPVV